MNKYLKGLLIGTMVLGAALLVGLAMSTRSSADFKSQYTILLSLNVAIIVVMMGLLSTLGVWLYRRFKHNVFGTRLLTRFALSFALLGVVPSIMLFVISTQFVSRTIDTWFNLKLDAALEAGLNFGREGLARANEQTRDNLNRVSLDLKTENIEHITPDRVNKWMKEYRWQTIAALDKAGAVVWQRNAKDNATSPKVPAFNRDILLKAREGWTQIEDESDTQDDDPTAELVEAKPNAALISPRIHGLHSLGNPSVRVQYLYVLRTMPTDFSKKVSDIQNGLRDYQATESSRNSLRNLYRVTLSITLLLTILAALAAAFIIANRMIQPILWLAQATRMVATGNYDLVPQRVKGSDELVQLVDSFANMTRQLDMTQTSLQHNQKELEAAKAYSEAVLENLSSGVLVFNHDFVLESYNRSACLMFQTDLAPWLNHQMGDIEPLAALYEPTLKAMKNHANSGRAWRVQQSLAFNHAHQTDDLTVSIQGSQFIAEDGEHSVVLVCDDISPIISAQRTLAWGEVARRLAHEIKNPLTPIQLSAERLNMKLHDKLDASDQSLLERSTRTIVNQVQALQNLADEFRDYARKPEIVFAPISLNALLAEILTLYEGGEDSRYHITSNFANNLPLILGDEPQLRQVIHNLIKNAIEAHAEGVFPFVSIVTERVALQADGLINTYGVRLSITDNGTGFSQKILARMFEPYNTSKNSGTGLGLPVVKKIIDAHHGKITIKNRIENNVLNEICGAQIDILFLNVVQNDNSDLNTTPTQTEPQLI